MTKDKQERPIIEVSFNNDDISLIEAIKKVNEGSVNVIVTNEDNTCAFLFKPGSLKMKLTIAGVAVLEPQYKKKDI